MNNASVDSINPIEYAIYDGECPHCKVILHMDFKIEKGVRKYRFPCAGCGKEISIEKASLWNDANNT